MKIRNIGIATFILIILTVGFIWWNSTRTKPANTQAPTQPTALTITSTNPPSLDEVTISPTQAIEITFSKPISVSELKYKIDPAMDHELKSTSGDSSFGQTFKITFKKPLDLGSALTLTISPETKVDDKNKLDKEYIYHIKTIGYKGA